jgi:DNA-binding CsgD family transcriptional regulator
MGEATEPDHREAPGLVILTERLAVASTTDSAAAWLADLPDADAGRLPAAVLTVAGRALRDGSGAFARVLSRSGRWVVLHGSPLREGGERRVAVIVEAADPARIYPLLMEAYRLTPRERDVTRQVLQGASTAQIAAGLHLSAHTVQQHLKNIFDKTGVRSRRDLVGKVFFSHYEPRFRDNEKRVAAGRPVRGGPAVR